MGLGADSGEGANWLGQMGHVYINLTTALDMRALANRQKFILGNNPVSAGKFGQLPTGTPPTWYLDGVAPAWNQLSGVGPSLTATGTLVAGSRPVLGSA